MSLRTNITKLLNSSGLWQGLIMTGGTLIAGVLDYGFNVVSGRLLTPIQYGVVVSVIAFLQIFLHVTNVIRNVIAYYTAELTLKPNAASAIGSFFRQSHRWAWRWGIVAMIALTVLSLPIANLLRIDNPAPLWAGSLAMVMLVVRPITDGTLQGTQKFWQLATVNIFQATIRVTAAFILIQLGLSAFGAVLALPIATFSAFGLAMLYLRPYYTETAPAEPVQVSLNYSTATFFGLLFFALITNTDILLVRWLFPEIEAATYAAAVTLGKINLFISLAVGLVLFPKAVERHNKQQPVWPILSMAFAATLTPGLLLTAVYFLFPAEIIQLVFQNDFADPGNVLGLIGLATTLFAGLNLWLNYALSTERHLYIYLLGLTLLIQFTSIAFFNTTLTNIATALVTAGLFGNLAGIFIAIRPTSANSKP